MLDRVYRRADTTTSSGSSGTAAATSRSGGGGGGSPGVYLMVMMMRWRRRRRMLVMAVAAAAVVVVMMVVVMVVVVVMMMMMMGGPGAVISHQLGDALALLLARRRRRGAAQRHDQRPYRAPSPRSTGRRRLAARAPPRPHSPRSVLPKPSSSKFHTRFSSGNSIIRLFNSSESERKKILQKDFGFHFAHIFSEGKVLQFSSGNIIGAIIELIFGFFL
ncbi:hypothetical protein chiPu_0002992 [Chiloscyllium punctatum]|uniref:Uncharacterized protein n=1 Tax=Chiloscyllium punctatum TaxID=137246 RepID=A0A401S2H5_CHIPU|nr:hypothetical protein [Chiloscyllium punctatum]